MKITVVVQDIPNGETAYSLLNFVRHVVVAGVNGGDSPEFHALPKDTPLEGADRTPSFQEPTVLHNVRFCCTDTACDSYRMIFHFTGGRDDLWSGTLACMQTFSHLKAVIIAIEPGGYVTVARADPAVSREISQRVFPAILADQLEIEFAGVDDELVFLQLQDDELFSITGADFLTAMNGETA